MTSRFQPHSIRRTLTLRSGPRSGFDMTFIKRSHAPLWGLFALLSSSPAFAFSNPLDRGPLADLLSEFREQAIPRQVVIWRHSEYGRGAVVVSTTERRLYYILGNGQAIEYGVGVGRQGFTWSGTKTVTRKREWPDWRPPAQMLKRRPDLPKHMAGGIENALGARAIYLGRANIESTARTSRTRSEWQSPPVAFA
jgi:L,D-transpeptidase catalytic domain